jgi:hypothetical protein
MIVSIILFKTDLLTPFVPQFNTMDYHSMSLVELKQAAKAHIPKIKQYYIKSRAELIQILSMTEFPPEMIINKKTIAELRKEAQTRQIPNVWKLRRSQLVDILYSSPKKDEENDNDGKKHDYPEKGKCNNIRIHAVKDTD